MLFGVACRVVENAAAHDLSPVIVLALKRGEKFNVFFIFILAIEIEGLAVKGESIKIGFSADRQHPCLDIGIFAVLEINGTELVDAGQPQGDDIKIQVKVKSGAEHLELFKISRSADVMPG